MIKCKKMSGEYKKIGVFFVLCPLVIFLLVTLIVKMLWNCILPDVLGVKTINYWQAMGILVLSKIFFGGVNARLGKRINNLKNKPIEKQTEGMTLEEKEKFKEIFKQKCTSHFFNKM